MIDQTRAISNHTERLQTLNKLKEEIEEKIRLLNTLNHGLYNASANDLGYPLAGEEIHSNKLVAEQPTVTYRLTSERSSAVTVAKKRDGTWSKKSDGRGVSWDAPEWYISGVLLDYSTARSLKEGIALKEELIIGKNEWLTKERLKG